MHISRFSLEQRDLLWHANLEKNGFVQISSLNDQNKTPTAIFKHGYLEAIRFFVTFRQQNVITQSPLKSFLVVSFVISEA